MNYFAVFDNKFQFTNVIDEVFLQSKQFVYLYLSFSFGDLHLQPWLFSSCHTVSPFHDQYPTETLYRTPFIAT